MPGLISRNQTRVAKTLRTDSTTPELQFSEWAGGSIFIPAGSPITTLTFFASDKSKSDQDPAGGQSSPTQFPMHTNDNNDTAITLTVSAGNCYALPVDCFAVAALYIRVNSAGAVTFSLKG